LKHLKIIGALKPLAADPTATSAGAASKVEEKRKHIKPTGKAHQGKGGRKPNLKRSALITGVVDRVVPDRDWRHKEKVYEILNELDTENGPDPENHPLLPPPPSWPRDRKWKTWSDCTDHTVAAKIIDHALKAAKKLPKN
jgi:hypothetical protein